MKIASTKGTITALVYAKATAIATAANTTSETDTTRDWSDAGVTRVLRTRSILDLAPLLEYSIGHCAGE
jgi:hypothetical protein